MNHLQLKKSVLFMLLLFGFVCVQAQNAIVLKMKDGTQNVVYLSAPDSDPSLVPSVTFDENDIVVRGDHELRVEMSDVISYVYIPKGAGIDDVCRNSPTVVFKGDIISVMNQEGAVVMIHAANGALVKRVVAQSNEATISLEDLTDGVYVITVGRSSYKFLK